MADDRGRILVVGVSTRAFVESAVRAGYPVAAVDAFGDRDQAALAPVLSMHRDLGLTFSAQGAVEAARTIDSESVTYASGFENHPAQVRRLARRRRLLGNPAGTLQRVRDPLLLARTLRERGFTVPHARATAPAGSQGIAWLLKQRASGGGRGVEPWIAGRAVSRHHYLQERITGVPGSVVFVADGRRAVPFGLSRQLVGDRRFGAGGFRYAGNILAAARDSQFPEGEALGAAAAALAQGSTDAFALVGVNGVDFVARGGIPFPIEVNPRPTASMELAERAYGASVFTMT